MRRALLLVVTGIFLTGCGATVDSFRPVTPLGSSITGLFTLALLISAAIFLLVVSLLAYVLVRFRSRGEEGDPPQTTGNRTLEIFWTGAAVVVLAVIFLLTVRTMSAVESTSPTPLTIVATGNQWWWEFRYPESGVVTANELHVPTGRPLRIELAANDVIHSFWVPTFGWKRDMIPGRTNVMNVQVDQPQVYSGACTEYCGTQHAWMRIRVVAQPPEAFAQWLQSQASPQNDTSSRGAELFLSSTCVNCHAIAGTSADAQVGPNLTHVGSRATLGAGVIENTPDNMARWIENANAIKPGVRMPSYTFSNSELQALVQYLEGLK